MILDDYEVSNVIQIQINSWLIMIENYLPILIVFILAAGFVFVSLILSHFVGPRINNKVKMMPYESGVDPVGETRIRFSIRFFLIALLFIIFDIEIVFLYPWAVVFKDFLTMGHLYFLRWLFSFLFLHLVLFMYGKMVLLNGNRLL